MKHIISVLFIFILCFALIPNVFASEVDSNEEIPQMDIDRTGWNAETVVQDTEYSTEDSIPTEVNDFVVPILEPLDIERNLLNDGGDVVVTTSVSPITPSNTNGLKKVMVGLIGNYDPVVVEYAYQSSQGYTSYLREVQPDYVWMISCAIFLVVLYSVFRIFGMVIKWHQ